MTRTMYSNHLCLIVCLFNVFDHERGSQRSFRILPKLLEYANLVARPFLAMEQALGNGGSTKGACELRIVLVPLAETIADALGKKFIAGLVEMETIGDEQFRARSAVRSERDIVGFDVT